MDEQSPAWHRRRKQKLDLRLCKIEQTTFTREQPSDRHHGEKPDPDKRRSSSREGPEQKTRRQRAATTLGTPPSRAPDAREHREIHVCRTGDGAHKVSGLAQPPEARAQAVFRAADDDVETRVKHQLEISRGKSRIRECDNSMFTGLRRTFAASRHED